MAFPISKGKAGLALLGGALIAALWWPFRCHHRKLSWPHPLKQVSGAANHYVVCLDCGQEFGYDWANMRLLRELKQLRRRIARWQDARSITDSRS
jgi:hypothetical protein